MTEEFKAIVVPLVIPMPAFKTLNEVALKQGKTVASLVREALEEKVEKINKELEKEKENGN